MSRHIKPKNPVVLLKPQGKGKQKVFSEVERRVDRAHLDCIVGPKGVEPTAKLGKRSVDLNAAMLAPRRGHEPIELSRRPSATAAAEMRKAKKSNRPSKQNKVGIDYSKPLPKTEVKAE